MNCHRRKSCWKREKAGPPYLAGYVSMSLYSVYLLFGFRDQESRDHCLPKWSKPKARQPWLKATNPLWINYGPLSALGRGTTQEPASLPEILPASLGTVSTGHLLTPSLLAADPSSHWIDTETDGKAVCKWWEEVGTSAKLLLQKNRNFHQQKHSWKQPGSDQRVLKWQSIHTQPKH